MKHFALTIIGRDCPGIVSQATEVLYHLGCNIEDSSCQILGGQFSMILIIATPQPVEDPAVLDSKFEPLRENGLSVFLRALRPGGERHPHMEGELCQISVYGADQPGIVYRVAKVMGELQINIAELDTKLVGSDENPVYVMRIEGYLPPTVELERVEQKMAELHNELNVDISVRSITAVEL